MNNATKYWFLENFSLMRKMGRWNLMQICERLEMKNFKKGEELLFECDDKKVIYFLKSGTVKIVTGDDNHTQSVVRCGNIFGELALTSEGGKVEKNKAIGLKDGVVCFIDAIQMQDFMERYPSLKNGIFQLNGFKIRKLERKLEDLLYKDSKTRIKEYLFDYLLENGVKKEKVIEAENLLSHSDIASLTNTSRQTVSNVMSALRKERVIDYDSTKIQRFIFTDS